MQKTDSNRECYLKGIYPVEVLSGGQDELVEVRAKTTFLHTSAYSDGKRQTIFGRALAPSSFLFRPFTKS